MTRIFKALFATYAVLVAIISCIIVIPAYLIIFNFFPKTRAPYTAHKLSRFWAKFLFTFFFIRVDVKGKEKIKPEQAYIFVCNHRSQLDIPLFARACTNTFRFLSKIEVTRIPVFGYVVKKLYITVDRKKRNDRAISFDKMKHSLLKEKISVILFPEGTRNRSQEPLLNFKDGAFRLAIETQLPIAVLTIFNTAEFLPADAFEMKPGIVRAVWDNPIETKGLTMEDIPMLKEKVRNILLRNSEQKKA
ncbi:MAG TPA: lysophospholipid acyltransferase family protein [Bacteroidia bacterium]|jgi:1-acyl-sn-glycerol-3-phosphate acyltransferase|nr:lysophospholipid acyltransferase family protein [Bacteroidia bacterium]